MYCVTCRAELPANAKFCFVCGTPVPGASGGAAGGTPPPPPSPAADKVVAPAGAQAVTCPSCGAPVHPVFGEMVISCDYCGATVTLGGAGWKEVGKHSMLSPKITTAGPALALVQAYLDQGFMHRKAFEESRIVEQKLSFVPFWVVPVAATTNYTYTDVAVGVGSTVGSIAAAELLGSVLGGGRQGGFVPIPVMIGSPVNATRQDAIAGQYDFPVVAVKGMTAYQPKDYQFALSERTFFDKKQIPEGAPVLNGDLGEDAAQHAARAYVMQLQTEAAHKRHHMVSGLTSNIQVSEAELVHVPIWYFLLDRKGEKVMILIDSHSGRVMQTVGGPAA
ncbi:MAG: zinc ribbon domain-containing protein [Thermoplasmata archaeon]|nr:zinc ribbon domain-containing protein [Thermoplasmata archaeon]MCI4362105.1 zinc ribbon domain-containing protein [Thermoplasmata archaeon]